MEIRDRWYHFIAFFFGAFFLANAFPHLINGIAGSPFQSPFGHPPGEGLSSAVSNVGWALANLAIAYGLLLRVGALNLRNLKHAAVFFAGFGFSALWLAHYFARFHGG